MTTSTFASVFVAAGDQAAAQAGMGEGFFTAPLSADGTEPATHYVSSGWFFNEELDKIVNDVAWPNTVKFGDAAQALADMGLQPCVSEQPQA